MSPAGPLVLGARPVAFVLVSAVVPVLGDEVGGLLFPLGVR
ncbi:hypothetical protein GA0070563_102551, partial [Micromonospora carbonacea]